MAAGSEEADDAKASAVLALAKDFIRKQRIGCVEDVYQTDRVIENAYEFVEAICEVVGYHEDEED